MIVNWNRLFNNQSVKVRFLTTLCINIARLGLGFFSGVIIARGLGPANYGNYSFLLGSFGSTVALLDMGTSSAFYTFLSQRKRSQKFYLYYFLWTGIQFITVLLLISFIFPVAWRNRIWLGQAKGMIILAFIASFMMNKVWETITQAGESIRNTIIVQLHNVIVAGLYLCIILVMALLRRLTVLNLFVIISFTYGLLSFMLAKRLKNNLIADETLKLSNMINEFKIYCTPLIIYGMVTFVYSFTDVWLLQRFGGAVQQGFYSVGLRFGVICLIATTSMLKVFWKEIVEANKLGDKERLHYLYTKASRALCFVGAVGACFLIPFSKEILVFLLGPRYEAGWPCLAIMFLYPIHQSLGQINGSYFYATAQTKLSTRIGIVMIAVSVFVTYFVLAPRFGAIPGLGLGSIGLALKMVTLQLITVNIFAYFICKRSKWEFDFLYQFKTVGFLLVAAFAIKGLFSWIFHVINFSFHPLMLIVLCMPIYILTAGLIVYLFPDLSGLERKQITNFIQFLHGFLRTRHS